MWPFDQILNPKRSYWLLCTFFFFIYILLESNTEKNIFPEKGHFSIVIVKCNRMGPEFLNLYLWIVQTLAASSIWELVETGQWISKTGGVDLVLLVIPRLYRVKKHIWVDICKTFLVYIIEKYDPKNCVIHSTDYYFSFPFVCTASFWKETLPRGDYLWKVLDKTGLKSCHKTNVKYSVLGSWQMDS